ncbi:MAG: ChaN family lipoprotein [Pyrinomonadaceae bacterium]
MKVIVLSLMLTAAAAITGFSQGAVPVDNYRVYDANGNPSSLDAVIKALGGVDVVFLGEQHDDSVAHALEFEIFQRAVDGYAPRRKVALSMEMFERDVQIVVNEYLNGQITEAQFLASSRPWGNYKTDYRPLVELAKEKRLPVIAANAPRRYVNMVSRGGRETLNGLTKDAKKWLAPLPYGEPSDVYGKKFKALMGPSPEAQMGIDNILASQSLWDATMSNSVANYLKKNKNALVVHLNGSFHTESRLGTAEHLLRYRKNAKVLVVTMRYEDDFKTFDKTKNTGIGDFVILTDTKQPRSKR